MPVKIFAVLTEQNVPDGENGIIAQLEIPSDSDEIANEYMADTISRYPDKTFKKFIHYCGNSSDGENFPCNVREIQ